MRIKSIGVIVAVAALAALVVPSLVVAAKVEFKAKLKGTNEVENGDPDGTGRAEVTTNRKKEKVCSTITYEDIADPVAAHIHEGRKGENGDIVVTLQPGSFESGAERCEKDVAKSLIKDIEANPRHYYVNVHTGEHPNGAIRGQLKLLGD